MLFGLCNAPAALETLMEHVLVDIPRTQGIIYLHNLLLLTSMGHSRTKKLCCLQSDGNPRKCSLIQRETHFLGYVASRESMVTNPDEMVAMQK